MAEQARNVHYVKNIKALGFDMADGTLVPDPCEINRYYVYQHPRLTPAVVKEFTDFGFDVYAPMATIQRQKGRRTVTQQVTRTMGYLFVYATLPRVDQFAHDSQYRPLVTHREPGQTLSRAQYYVTVPDAAMQAFRTIMEATDGMADLTLPTQQQLAKGDTILVLRGAFAGIQGTLLSNQGAHSHTIHIHMAQGLGINIRVPATDVAILRFSRQGNHVTTHLRAIESQMTTILQHHSQHQALTSHMVAWLTQHIQRYGSLTGLTHAMSARYMVHLYLAHQLLGQPQQAHQLLDAYRQAQSTDPRARRSAGRAPTTAQYIQHWTTLLTKS